MTDPAPLLLRARVVLPVSRPPIEDGAVVVFGYRIAAVGRWRDLRKRFSGATQDLGEMVLLPGLVNGHCHLDYTHMAGLFPPRKSYCDWIKLITTEKAQWNYSDFAESWLDGANMLVRTGTTTVGDIEAVPDLLPEVWDATPLRVISFLEMTGVRSRRLPELILREALEQIASLTHERCAAALSPHAPYSTPPRLLQLTAAAARQRRLRVATHVAESATEFEMFRRARGEMFDWLARNHRDMSDCGGVSPVQQLTRQHALGPHLLAVHANCLAPGDAALLMQKRVSVVHCPRSHDYFKHLEFPFRELTKAGVNVCLGTDSLATVRKHPKHQLELNLFHEMRAFASAQPHVAPEIILQMVTLNGARALGLRGKIGGLKRDFFADLITLPYSGKLAEVCKAVVQHTGDVAASMIAGRWVIAPN
jgi:cytosine/adenosine deaminase-related metal-dependent hydrolase